MQKKVENTKLPFTQGSSSPLSQEISSSLLDRSFRGFNLVGSGEKGEDCLKYKPYATAKKGNECLKNDVYFKTSSNHIVLGHHYCQRRDCPVCNRRGWVSVTSSRSTDELTKEFQKMCLNGKFLKEYDVEDDEGVIRKIKRRLKFYCAVISVPPEDYPDDEEGFQGLRTKVNKIAKKHGFINFRGIPHPFRGLKDNDVDLGLEDPPSQEGFNFRNMDLSKLSLHFHIVGYGYFIEPGGTDGDYIFKVTSGKYVKGKGFQPGALGTVLPFYYVGEDPDEGDIENKKKIARRKQYDLKGLSLYQGVLWERVKHRIGYYLDHGGWFERGDYISQVITGCGPRLQEEDEGGTIRPGPMKYYQVHREYAEDDDLRIMDIVGDTFLQESNFKEEFLRNDYVKDLFEKENVEEITTFSGYVDGHCIGESSPDHDPLSCKWCKKRKTKLLEKLGVYHPEDHSRYFFKGKDPPPNGIRLGLIDPVWIWVHGKGGGLGFIRDDEIGRVWDAKLICTCYPKLWREFPI